MVQNQSDQTPSPETPGTQSSIPERRKKAWLSIMSLVGLIVLLVGVLSPYLPWPWWLIIALIFWVGSGILGRYWGIRK